MHAKEAKEMTRKFYIDKFFGQYTDIFNKIKEAAQSGAYHITLPNQSGKINDFEKFRILMKEYFNYAVLIRVETEDPQTHEGTATLIIDWEKA